MVHVLSCSVVAEDKSFPVHGAGQAGYSVVVDGRDAMSHSDNKTTQIYSSGSQGCFNTVFFCFF